MFADNVRINAYSDSVIPVWETGRGRSVAHHAGGPARVGEASDVEGIIPQSMRNLFWVDMEMTGLDPEQCVIIEFAGIVTNPQLAVIDRYEAVVFQPPEALERMDEWNKRTHSASGLVERIPHGKALAQVEEEVLTLIQPHFTDAIILAGNSIHQDRRFIDRHMQRLAAKLHYRMVDVSSFKEIFRTVYHLAFPKENAHRALDDIEASIAELRYYMKFIQVPKEVR